MCPKCGHPLRGPPDLAFTCIPCRRKRLYFRCARSAGIYDGALREAIHALKFDGRRALAKPLGLLMADAAIDDPRFREVEAVIPVPLHPQRLKERGFNQSELLANAVAQALNRPVAALLRRIRPTAAQSGLSEADRRKNVRDAFAATGRLDGVVALLVDDVLSTGSTTSACARELTRAGAEEVLVLTAAVAAWKW